MIPKALDSNSTFFVTQGLFYVLNYFFHGLIKGPILLIQNLKDFESMPHDLYPFTPFAYSKNIHFLAFGSNLPSFIRV